MTFIKAFVYIVLGVAIFWLFGLKLMIKLGKGRSAPCPGSLSWLVDLPIRKRYMKSVLAHVELKPGEIVLELGPGPGAFTIDAARMVGDAGKLIAVDV